MYLNKDNKGDHRLFDDSGRESVEIVIARLDDVLQGSNFIPDLVKIDVQGSELGVFIGARETFIKSGSSLAICMEFEPNAMPGGTAEANSLAREIFDLQHPVFVLYPYDGGSLQPLNLDTLDLSIEGCMHPSRGSTAHVNLLIAPTDKRFALLKPFIGRDFVQWAV